MTEELKERLLALADKYEVSSFCDQDPSQFLRWYSVGQTGTEFTGANATSANVADIESAAFLAAMLAFGNRKLFIPKIRSVLEMADKSCGSFSRWLKSGTFKKDFPKGSEKFYRFYSYDDMQIFFEELAGLLEKAPSLGEYFKEAWRNQNFQLPQAAKAPQQSTAPLPSTAPQQSKAHRQPPVSPAAPSSPFLHTLISAAFPRSKIVPKGSNSANKRIHMFLRWMVRTNSAVDLGLWTWYNPANLLIPLDVHVMQEAVQLGLLPPNASPSHRTALLLTKELAQAFPNDPARADFALFGLGVS